MSQNKDQPASAHKLRRARESGLRVSLDDMSVAAGAVAIWLVVSLLADAGLWADMQALLRASLLGRGASVPQMAERGARMLVRGLALPMAGVALCLASPSLVRGLPVAWLNGGRSADADGGAGGQVGAGAASLPVVTRLTAAGWAVLRVGVFTLLCLHVVQHVLPSLRSLPLFSGPGPLATGLHAMIGGLVARYLVALGILLPLGLWLQRFVYLRALRMGRDEQLAEQRREALAPEVAQAMARQARQTSAAAPGTHERPSDIASDLAATTHVLYGPSDALLLHLPMAQGARAVMLRRMASAAAERSLRSHGAEPLRDAALFALLGGLGAGDTIPTSCYRAVAAVLASARREQRMDRS